ncbi:MAG: endonuclease III [Pseudothermotoga sp.]
MEKIAREIVRLFPRNSFTEDPFKILISTILSQRTRDENTELATARLFERFPDLVSLATARPEDLYELIKPSGMYKQKALRIIQVSQKLLHEYNARVPADLEELLKLPGVGRKTANIVLYHGFGKSALAVDTHVHRISNRLGFVKTSRPEQTEEELSKLVPKELWGPLNGSMVEFGRTICQPRRPKCHLCNFKNECKYFADQKLKSGDRTDP